MKNPPLFAIVFKVRELFVEKTTAFGQNHSKPYDELALEEAGEDWVRRSVANEA